MWISVRDKKGWKRIMKISKLLDYVMIGIPLLLSLLCLTGILAQGKKNIVDTLKTGMRHFKRRFWIIILAGVIYIAFFVLSLEITRMTEATIRIGLNYPSSSSGLNPNNTKFSVSEILDDDVLEAAIVKGGFSGVTAEELKGCLLVTPVDDGETISIDQYYISTEYNLEYAASWKTRSLDPEKVVNSVAECYYEKFIQMYSRKTNILEMDFSDTDNTDYLDMADIIDAKADSVQTYAVMLQAESRSFQSEETGETFTSLEKKINSFRDVQIERYRAFVLENGLVRDRTQYISKLNYINRISNIYYMKHLTAYQVRLEAIDKYERDMASIVLVPTEDENREFYMSRTQIGVDYFAREAEERLSQATKEQLGIATNNYTITQMLNSTAEDAKYRQAEEMLSGLENELTYYAQLMKTTLQEYDKKTSGDYLSLVYVNSRDLKFTDRFQVKKGAVYTAIFLVFSVLLMFVLPVREKRRK